MASDPSAVLTPSHVAPAAADWRLPLGVGLIILASCVVYFPAMNGEFLWDDDVLLTNNRLIHASDGWSRMWSLSQPVDYWPVSNLTLWTEFRLWGMRPTGYHVTNLVIHIGVSLLVWAVLLRLEIPGAFLAGLIFAVHPVNVESVAWIAQRKTNMACFFGLLSMLWYLKADERQDRRLSDLAVWPWYVLSWLAFVLGTLSKASIAPLPVVLLGLCWWRRGRIARRDLVSAAAFFMIAAVLVVVNMQFQASSGAARDATFAERLAGAGAVPWFYLYKALLPVNLVFIYPQWEIDTSQVQWWLPLAATIVTTALLWWQRHTPCGRAVLFAWCYFCAMLVPVLGFADIGFLEWSLVADHYQYVAIVGPIALVAAGLSIWHARAQDPNRIIAVACAVGLVSVLMALSWQQSKMYVNAETHWQTTIDKNPTSYVAHNNLGILLLNKGQFSDAIERFERAVALKPQFAEAHGNLVAALAQTGRRPEALEHAQEAVRLRPSFVETNSNLGSLLLDLGRPQEAIASFETAARLDPINPVVHNNLGNALLKAGRAQEAIAQFQEALRLIPDADSPESLQRQTAARAGQLQAIAASQQVAERMPDAAEPQFNLGNALVKAGRPEDAIGHFEKALAIRPDFADAHLNLAGALFALGKQQEAIDHCRTALELKPESVEAHYNLGTALLTVGDTSGAITQYEEAVRLRPDYAEAWGNLAIARARVGQIAEAVAAAEKAQDLARAQNKTALAQQLDAWMQSLPARAGPPAPP